MLQPFNFIHFLSFVIVPFFYVFFVWYFTRKKTNKQFNKFSYIVFGVVILFYIIGYIVDVRTVEGFKEEIYRNLPLSLCSLNMFLFPLFFYIGNKTKKEKVKEILYGYMFFAASAGGLFGLIMPLEYVYHANVLNYRVLIYLIRHIIIFGFPIILILRKEYVPKIKNIFTSLVFVFGIITIIHGVNLLLTKIAGYTVDHIYTMGTFDNPIIQYFWNITKIPYVYMFPILFIVTAVFFLYYFIYLLIRRIIRQLKSPQSDKNL